MSVAPTPFYQLIKQKQEQKFRSPIKKGTRDVIRKKNDEKEIKFTKYQKHKTEKQSLLIKTILEDIEKEISNENCNKLEGKLNFTEKENKRNLYPGVELDSVRSDKNSAKLHAWNREYALLSRLPPGIILEKDKWREVNQVSLGILKDNFLKIGKENSEFEGNQIDSESLELEELLENSGLKNFGFKEKRENAKLINVFSAVDDPLKIRNLKIPGKLSSKTISLTSILLIQKHVRGFLCRKKYLEKKQFLKSMFEQTRREMLEIQNSFNPEHSQSMEFNKEDEIEEDFTAKTYKLPATKKLQDNLLYPLLKQNLIANQNFEDLLLFESEEPAPKIKKKKKKLKPAQSAKKSQAVKSLSKAAVNNFFAPTKNLKLSPFDNSSKEVSLVRTFIKKKDSKAESQNNPELPSQPSSEYTVGDDAFESYSEEHKSQKFQRESSESGPQSYISDTSYKLKNSIKLVPETLEKSEVEPLNGLGTALDEEIAIISSYEDSDYQKFDSYTSIPPSKLVISTEVKPVKERNSNARIGVPENRDQATKIDTKKLEAENLRKSQELKNDLRKHFPKEKVNKEVNTDPICENEEGQGSYATNIAAKDYKLEALEKIKRVKLNKELENVFDKLLGDDRENNQFQQFSQTDNLKENFDFTPRKMRTQLGEQYKINKMRENLIINEKYEELTSNLDPNLLSQLFLHESDNDSLNSTLTNLERQQEFTYELMMQLYNKILEGEDLTNELETVKMNIEALNQKLNLVKIAQNEIKVDEKLEKDFITYKRPVKLRTIRIQEKELPTEINMSVGNRSFLLKGSGEKGILKVQKPQAVKYNSNQKTTSAKINEPKKRIPSISGSYINEEIGENMSVSSQSLSNHRGKDKNQIDGDDDYLQVFESSSSVKTSIADGGILTSLESEQIEEAVDINSSNESEKTPLSADKEVSNESASSVSWTENI